MRNLLFFFLLGFQSCFYAVKKVDVPAEQDPFQDTRQYESNPAPLNPMSRSAYLAKLSRLLRNNQELRPAEFQALKKQKNSEIIDQFLASKEFVKTVMDFNLYFLHNKIAAIENTFEEASEDLKLDSSIYDSNRAIKSAINFSNTGNYLALLEWNLPMYIRPFKRPYPVAQEQADNGESDQQRRKNHLRVYREKIHTVLAKLETMPELEGKKYFCNLQAQGTNLSFASFIALYAGEFGPLFFFFNLNLDVNKALACLGQQYDRIHPRKEINQLLGYAKQLEQFTPELIKENYKIYQLEDIKTLPFELDSADQFYTNFAGNFTLKFTNSSTNFNRRRAAYILATYFCDDLTPIGFVSPSEHAQDRHASDPKCMACHYKLDPLAGFFKNYGILGANFKGQNNIIFDDQATMDLLEYQSAWKDKTGQREWNIGYIRSQSDTALNDYGESIEDLFNIIQRAPEVKACLVKRMTEYFIGEELTLDQGWLRKLTQEFIQEAKSNSSVAFKNTVKKIVMSNAFREWDPLPNTCYDYPYNRRKMGAPPCAVDDIIERNCLSCHQSTAQKGRLNLGRWIKTDTGFGFEHLDRNGQQISVHQSFQAIKKRISAHDVSIQMPPEGRYLSSKDRETLFLWLVKQLEEKK